MPNDCFIKNLIRKKPWLAFLFYLALIWVVSIFLLIGIKYCYFKFYEETSDWIRISLSNILTLGAMISASAFALKQVEINQHTTNVELAIRYKDHYVELIKKLRNFVKSQAELSDEIDPKVQESIWIELLDVVLEGQLIFDEEIRKLNENIQLYTARVFNHKNTLKNINIQRDTLEYQLAEENYRKAYNLLTGQCAEDSIFDQITKLYKKKTSIISI